MFMFHFPHRDDVQLDRPEKLFDPTVCDVVLNKDVSMLALLLEDVYVIHSHGTATAAHTEADIELLGEACRQAARRFKPYL
jgi:3-oxoacyl-(acyl-carrier-protein) synthase